MVDLNYSAFPWSNCGVAELAAGAGANRCLDVGASLVLGPWNLVLQVRHHFIESQVFLRVHP